MSLPPEIESAIKTAIKSGKFKSIGDIEDYVFDLMMEYNRKSQPDMLGLSPHQVHRLINSDWQSETSAIHLNEDLSYKELKNSPFYINALLFMKLAADPIKQTVAGNLNRKFVCEIMETMVLDSDYKKSIYHVNKVINEEDIWPLHILRVILQLSGLIRKNKGAFVLSKKGKELSDQDAAGHLFSLLFKVHFNKFNLSYIDRFPLNEGIDKTIPFALYALHRVGAEWRSPENLKDLLWLRAVKNGVQESNFDDYLLWQTKTRLLKPLISFGLLMNKDHSTVNEKLLKNSLVKKSQIYDRFLRFTL